MTAPVAAQQPVPTFRSSVSLVSVNAVVKDRRGRPVRNLKRDDFQILENGAARPIVDFGFSDQGPVAFGVLVDQSGSMSLSNNLDAAREVIRHLLAWFDPGKDEVALFAFDQQLARGAALHDAARTQVVDALPKLSAYGTTALYDAIGETASRLESRPSPRRAVIVVTDGLDTASTQDGRGRIRHRQRHRRAGVRRGGDVARQQSAAGRFAAAHGRRARSRRGSPTSPTGRAGTC